MEYIITHLVLVAVVKLSNSCTHDIKFTENPVNENLATNINCEWDFDNCHTHVIVEKEIDGIYETAMKFEELGKFEGFELSNGISYRNSSRITGVSVQGLSAIVIHAVTIKDGGNWRCTLVDDKNNISNPETLVVYSKKGNVHIRIDPPDHIILGTPHEYNCSAYSVNPQLDVIWMVNGVNRTSTSKDVDHSHYWDIINTLENTLITNGNYNVSCTMGKLTENTSWTKTEQAPPVRIFVPIALNNSYVSHTKPTPDQNFTMSCTVSGTSTGIEWHHNDSDINTSMFTRTNETIIGDFEFSESHALRSTLVWIVPDKSKWCEELDKFSGQYQCTGNSIKEPHVSSDMTSVIVQYSPIMLGKRETLIYANVGTEVKLNCATDCARPDVFTYTWTSEHDREGLDKDLETISIVVTDQDFNVTFTCTVNNTVGSIKRTFIINDTEVPTQPESTSEPPTTEIVIDESPNQALVTAFAVIWSLCGVFAILLACLALYHYKQIQNGEKYQGDYSEEIVLTEDEAKPGTSQSSGEYDDISPVVVGKGGLVGAIGGVTNEGLYAEVQAPAQNKLPVAPKSTPYVKALHPQPSTPKATRIHSTKSPTNTRRHQPNSPSTDRCFESKPDYSTVSNKNEMQPKHSNESNHETASKDEQQHKRCELPNKRATMKQNINGAKPSVPNKPNIISVCSSRRSGINPAGAPYDNAEVNLYANRDQRPVPNNDDGTITYADLALQHEDPYDEGAPPVLKKQVNYQEPVQYARIKHSK